jgi:antitoxin VbhA-like protein
VGGDGADVYVADVIDDDERKRRADIVRNMIAIDGFEGGEPSAYLLELSELWIAGEITVEELCDRIVDHHSKRK